MSKTHHRTTVELDKEIMIWYNENFPKGTLWLTINKLLKEFKDSFEGDSPTNFYINYKTPAEKLKEKLAE